MYRILKPNGRFLIVEPKLFHVTKKVFEETISKAKEIGFVTSEYLPPIAVFYEGVLRHPFRIFYTAQHLLLTAQLYKEK